MASSRSSKVMQHIFPNSFTLLISVLFAPLWQIFSSLGTKLRIGLKNGPGQIRIVIFSLFSNRMIRISSVEALLSIITTVLIPRISFQSSKAHTLVQTAVRFYLQRWHRKRKPSQTLLQTILIFFWWFFWPIIFWSLGFLRRPQNLKKSLSYVWQEHRNLCAQQRTCQKVDEDFSKQMWSSRIYYDFLMILGWLSDDSGMTLGWLLGGNYSRGDTNQGRTLIKGGH